MAWKKVCSDLDEGGLGIKSLICLNEATNLKLCWDLMHSKEQWAIIIRNRTLRGTYCIHHHIFSSIWNGIKQEFNTIKENTTWLVGNGEKIQFWSDSWCREPILQALNLTQHQIQEYPQRLSSFIHNHQWNIPDNLHQILPNLRRLFSQVTIPIQQIEDELIWYHNNIGTLTMKDAFEFKQKHFLKKHWAKLMWSKDFPPSKSLMVWRLMMNKLPTDENLITRGCNIPSMCSLCNKQVENSFHLFFEFPYSINIWCWFASILNLNLQFQSIDDIWSICERAWNPQCKTVIIAAMINIINCIWFAKNQIRFNNQKIHWKSSVSLIIANTTFIGNYTSAVASSVMTDFIILNKFNVMIHPPKAPKIIEVLWNPPTFQCIKCNTDGSANHATSACGGIFRDKYSNFLLCFAQNTGQGTAFQAELCGAVKAIELAHLYQWKYLWLKVDSALVVHAITNNSLVPWKIRNRWNNCMVMIQSMSFLDTHIYREGNNCDDTLANIGLNLDHLTIWTQLPVSISSHFAQNRLGMPRYRFVNH